MRHKARKTAEPTKTQTGEGARERESAKERGREGFMTGRLAGRQAMIINRHKFKLSVTNLGLSLFLARGRPGHAHCVNKPHNDQKISEAATRVATRCAQAAASPKNGSPKANTIRLSGAFAASKECEERRGEGQGCSCCWQQVKQRIKFIKYPHLKAPLAKN